MTNPAVELDVVPAVVRPRWQRIALLGVSLSAAALVGSMAFDAWARTDPPVRPQESVKVPHGPPIPVTRFEGY